MTKTELKDDNRLKAKWFSYGNLIRGFLFIYFIIIAGVVAYHLKPLPEQKPVIEFAGFTVVLFSILFAVGVIRTHSFWLILSLFPAIPAILWMVHQKNRYLEMALEESAIMKALPYTFIPIIGLLLIPATYRVFSDKTWTTPPKLLIFKKGIPF